MDDKFLSEKSHKRLNILTREWILVAPHRAKRPWQGQVEDEVCEKKLEYDPECYLCSGNMRAGGKKNPPYTETFVFDNDFSSLQLDSPVTVFNKNNLLVAQGEPGICRVICFSPRHDLTLAEMEAGDIKKVIDVWQNEYVELGKNKNINYVTIFENKGAMMGCSNPHPHGQIWAQNSIPNLPAIEMQNMKKYMDENHNCLLCDYLKQELELNERIIIENEHFAALVPFWATWPYETLLISKRHINNISFLKSKEKASLAEILKRLTSRYDNLFKTSFPYSAGFHQSPTDGNEHNEWHMHMHFYPPLLRSAAVKKFMVGYELLSMAQRDITPESSAQILSELSDIHYKKHKQI